MRSFSSWTRFVSISKPRRGSWAALLGCAALFGSPVLAQEDSPRPVVVAVDTSRSLNPVELEAAVTAVEETLAALPAETPSGLVAFDDQPHWVAPVGSSLTEVTRQLRTLQPRGLYTLLNDALFATTREIESGGVILLVSDGRDENSATTIDDIARRCESQGIRIVAVGTGRGIAVRALRRLALVSDGAYLGELGQVEPAALAGQLGLELEEIERESASLPVAEPAEPNPIASVPEPVAQPVVSPSTEQSASMLPWIVLALGAALATFAVWFVLRSRTKAKRSFCEVCGTELEVEGECARCDEEQLQRRLQSRPVAALGDSPEVSVDTAIFEQLTLEERLERTRVLAYESVLNVIRPGEPQRSYLIGREKAFGVGRVEVDNTLALPDPALSSQHFKIVPDGDHDYLVDLGSTNGSFVNGRRCTARQLVSGDLITAGQVDFEYKNHTTTT